MNIQSASWMLMPWCFHQVSRRNSQNITEIQHFHLSTCGVSKSTPTVNIYVVLLTSRKQVWLLATGKLFNPNNHILWYPIKIPWSNTRPGILVHTKWKMPKLWKSLALCLRLTYHVMLILISVWTLPAACFGFGGLFVPWARHRSEGTLVENHWVTISLV